MTVLSFSNKLISQNANLHFLVLSKPLSFKVAISSSFINFNVNRTLNRDSFLSKLVCKHNFFNFMAMIESPINP